MIMVLDCYIALKKNGKLCSKVFALEESWILPIGELVGVFYNCESKVNEQTVEILHS